MGVRNEGDGTGAVELDEGGDARCVLRLGVLRGRPRKRGSRVVLDVDDVGHGTIVGDEGELLLDALRLEEGCGLAVRGREGGAAIDAGVGLRLRLEERDCIMISEQWLLVLNNDAYSE